MKNNFKEYGFEAGFEGEVLKKVDHMLIGYVVGEQLPNQPIPLPISWNSKDGLACGTGDFWHNDSLLKYSLKPLKPQWYVNRESFPALVFYKRTNEYFIVNSYNGKGKLRVAHSQKFLHADDCTFINSTKLLNFTDKHQDSREDVIQNLQKTIHNLVCDVDDYNSFTISYRCPCCHHIVNRGNVCGNCGCDSGLLKDKEYSCEEIASMISKSRRIN